MRTDLLFHLYFFVALGTFAASIILIFRSRTRLWAGIQLFLTLLVVCLTIGELKIGSWLHSLDTDDPTRQWWQTNMEPYCEWIVSIILISWIVFTAMHVGAILKHRSRFNP